MKSNVVPIEIAKWAREKNIHRFIVQRGYSLSEVLARDINMKVTGTGGTLLHLAIAQSPKPSLKICVRVIEFLVNDCAADVNNPDDYGRTPLMLLLDRGMTLRGDHACSTENSGPALEGRILELMLKSGGNPSGL